MIKRTPVNGGDGVRVQFVLPEERLSGEVAVVGEFNDWNPRSNKLRRRTNGTRSTTVLLESGRRYVFRYLAADGAWYDEETADGAEPNGYGSWNSVLKT